MTALAPYLSTFLLEHLPRERNASPHTSEAYAHSFKLLICFAAAQFLRRLRAAKTLKSLSLCYRQIIQKYQ
jgi:site-specific recombinase XerC